MYEYDPDKPVPGEEDFCSDCKSQYAVADYDGAVGEMILSNECDDYDTCAYFSQSMLEYTRRRNEDRSINS